MDFADILNEIAQPASGIGGDPRSAPRAPDFQRILDGLARSVPAGDAVRQAYFPPDLGAGGLREARAALGDIGEADLSTDPDDIAFELDLGSVASRDELSGLRRRFARLNHPDRVPAALRARANLRMTLANAMIDKAEARFTP